MAGRGDIEAGRAFVKLFLKDSLTGPLAKTINKVGQGMQSMGRQAAMAGAGLTAMGSAIVAPFVASVKHFAGFGDELDKMSQRTGIAAPALAELGFAAEQSGTDLNKVENAVRKMQKTIGDADRGLSTAVDALDALGLSAAQLEGMTPEDQFQAIADRVGAIEDPTKKAAAAMEVFGSRTGTALLPMLDGLSDLRQEAQDLGIVPTEKAVKDAAKVTDAINRIKRSVAGAAFEIGASLADSVLTFAATAQKVVVNIGTWARENAGLLKTIAAVGAALVAAGSALVAFGGAAIVIGASLSAVAGVVSSVAAVIGLLFTPLGVVASLLVGGTALWARYTSSGQAAIGGLMNLLGEFAGIGKDTFGGIKDALATGDLAGAGKIAIAGLQAAMSTGLDALVDLIGGRMGEFIGELGGQLIQGDLAGAWQTVMGMMTGAWTSFTGFVFDSFGISIDGIIEGASSAVSAIRNVFSGIMEFASILTASWDQTWKIFKASALVGILGARDQLKFVFMEWFPAVISATVSGLISAFAVAMENWKTLAGAFAELMVNRLTAVPRFLANALGLVFDSLKSRFESIIKVMKLVMSRDFKGAAQELVKGQVDATKGLLKGLGREALAAVQAQVDVQMKFNAEVGPAAMEAAAAFGDAFGTELGNIDTSVSVDLQAAQQQLAVEIQAGIDARDKQRAEGKETEAIDRPSQTEKFKERLKELVLEQRTKRETKEKEVAKAEEGGGKEGIERDEADQKKKTFAQVSTFSAAAAVAMSFGQGEQAATDPAKETRKLGRILKEQERDRKKAAVAAEKTNDILERWVVSMAVR